MSGRKLVLIPGFSMEIPEKRLGGLFPFLCENNTDFDIIRFLQKVVAEKSIVGWNLDRAVQEAKAIIKAKELRGTRNAFVYSYGLTVVSQLSKELIFGTMVFYAPVFGPGTVIYRDQEKPFPEDPERFPGFAELENKEFWYKIYDGLAKYKEEEAEMIFLLPPENNGFRQDGRVKYADKDVKRMEIFGEIRTLPEPNHYIEGNNLEETKKCISEGN